MTAQEMTPEERKQYSDMRYEQIRWGMTEAIRREVAWLEEHNFPIWIEHEGKIVDARFLEHELGLEEETEPKGEAGND